MRNLVPTVFANVVALMPTIAAADSPFVPRMAADPVYYDDFAANRKQQDVPRRAVGSDASGGTISRGDDGRGTAAAPASCGGAGGAGARGVRPRVEKAGSGPSPPRASPPTADLSTFAF